MYRHYFIAIFLGLFLVVLSGEAFAALDRCPRHQVDAQLQGKLAKTKTFRGSSRAFTEYVQGHSRGSSRILGFVNQAEIYTQMTYQFDLKEIGDGKYCVMLEKVRGYFYAAPKLYMPSDYGKKSCEYQQIKKHETRHLNAVYNFHKRNTSKYAAYLGKIVRTVPILPPVSTQREVEEAQRTIASYFENKFREQEYESISALSREQMIIDSPQEYIGVSKRCRNW